MWSRHLVSVVGPLLSILERDDCLLILTNIALRHTPNVGSSLHIGIRSLGRDHMSLSEAESPLPDSTEEGPCCQTLPERSRERKSNMRLGIGVNELALFTAARCQQKSLISLLSTGSV